MGPDGGPEDRAARLGRSPSDPGAPGRRRSDRVWICAPGVGGVVVALAASGLLGSLEPAAMFVVGVGTLLSLVLSVRLHRPALRWPWWAISGSVLLFIVGGAARADLHTLGNLGPSRSLVPDLVSLPGYVLGAAGLLGFSRARDRARGSQHHFGVILDGVIAALALLAVAWVYVIYPVLVHHHTPLTVRLLLTCYPAMSLFLVVVTVRIAFSPEQRRVPSYWFLLATMTAMFVGDTLYMFADVDLVHVAGRFLDLPYAIAFVATAAMALHPSMRALTEPAGLRPKAASPGRVVLVALGLLVPAVITLQHPSGSMKDRVALFVIIVMLTGAAVLRIVQALHLAERSEADLAYQATHDSLTGLPNRRMMREHLDDVLARAAVDDTHVALLFLDLDRFKLVNDTLGHTHGDELLVDVARRLQEHMRPSDLVTRIGGDEFMVVLGQVVSVSQALELAHRLRTCLRTPFMVNGMEFYVSASIGLSFASGDDPRVDAELLVRDADMALYQAKDAGRDAVAVFDESMRTRISERVELEHDLRRAVELRQLHLVYQPIIRIPDGPVEGVEALVRWAHPTLGVIPPVKFIPLAEDTGLIKGIGEWVLQEAVRQLAAWRRDTPGLENLYVTVNVSGAQLHDERLVERVAAVLERNGVPGNALCLELTESVVMEEHRHAIAIFTELRRLDVRLAIDDFGTEYSSLAYLKRFPVTNLKIDRSFVENLDDDDSSDATLIAAVVAMAHALGIATVAEGVETSTQARRLVDLGCDAVQGYLYSRPVQAESVPYVITTMWKRDGQARLEAAAGGR
ncbi:MAG TPA: EAL domain-containing protein [Acidimicrobiales bacterium]|nr:EAL domain-containing protein [Acidimicrobiales bacterium]